MRKQHLPVRYPALIDLVAAQEWIDACLSEVGIVREGETEMFRNRSWSDVAVTPTSDGRVFLKAPGDTTAFEISLYEILAAEVPDFVLEPIGLDQDRGWVLMRDAGPSFGERYDGAELAQALTTALGRYATLQIALASHRDAMEMAGVADFSPAALPQRLDEALDAADATAPSGTDGTSELRRRRNQIEALIGELQAAPGEPTIDHNDLHPWNLLGDPLEPETVHFYDWGDSVIQHPFASAALPLGFVERADPSHLPSAIDAYLEPFAALGSRSELIRTLEVACRTARIARTITWFRAIQTEDADPKFAHGPYETLNSIFDESWTTRS